MNALASTLGLENGVAERCLALIRVHGPRLMRTGGGSLPREVIFDDPVVRRKLDARIVALRAEGRRVGKIAEELGCSRHTVRRALLATR